MQFKNDSYDRPMFPVGVNVFVIRDGRLLLGGRKGGVRDGQWGLPGGHLEYGEKMVDCAARELLEETGISAASFRFIGADNDTRQGDMHFVHFGFVAENPVGEPQLLEPDLCYRWEWFALDALPTPLFIGHEKLIRSFISNQLFVE